jgi:hypothetical protein
MQIRAGSDKVSRQPARLPVGGFLAWTAAKTRSEAKFEGRFFGVSQWRQLKAAFSFGRYKIANPVQKQDRLERRQILR